MAKQKQRNTINITVDADLAIQYREAYARAFGFQHEAHSTLESFISAFVADRLSEELEFVNRDESMGVHR